MILVSTTSTPLFSVSPISSLSGTPQPVSVEASCRFIQSQLAENAISVGLGAVLTNRSLGGFAGFYKFKAWLADQDFNVSPEEIGRVFKPTEVPENTAVVTFISNVQATSYSLTTRQAELVRRLLDNAQLLTDDTLLSDILACLSPSPSDPVSPSSTNSLQLEIQLPVDQNPDNIRFVDTLVEYPEERLIIPAPYLGRRDPSNPDLPERFAHFDLASESSSDSLPLLSSPSSESTRVSDVSEVPDHGPEIPELLQRSLYITRWHEDKYPVEIGRPSLIGSYEDFCASLLAENRLHRKQISKFAPYSLCQVISLNPFRYQHS